MPDVKYSFLRGNASGIDNTELVDGQILFDEERHRILLDVTLNGTLTRIVMTERDTFNGTTAEWEALTEQQKAMFTYVNFTDDYEHTTSIMEGATAIENGTAGIVPRPLAGDQDKYLKGDGTWATMSGGHVIEDSTGTTFTQRTNLKINNATITDDSENDTTIVTPAGGGGSETNFVGTQEEWNALTTEQKAEYTTVDIINTYEEYAVDQTPLAGSANLVTSNGIQEAIVTKIAGTEQTSTSSQAYTVGQYLILNGILYKVIDAIAQGDTLTVGTNISAVRVADEISNHLCVDGTEFYFDYKNGKYGYNTSANRGADSFVPFSYGVVASNYELVGDNIAGGTPFTIDETGNYLLLCNGIALRGGIPSSTAVPCDINVTVNDEIITPLHSVTQTVYGSYDTDKGMRTRDRFNAYCINCDYGDIITATATNGKAYMYVYKYIP